MNKLSDNEKNNLLEEVIFSLSKGQSVLEDQKEVEKYCIKLEEIYSSDNGEQFFRHNYSDIFGWLSQIDRDISGKNGNLDILAQNIEYIKQFYHEWKQHGIGDKNVHKQIGKLYDHINLDIARMNYLKTIYNDRENKLEGISEQVKFLEKQTKNEIEKAEDIGKKVNNAYSEFVSILGIFSAIVMVFFGGASIFANIFSAIEDVSIYKGVIVCVITGIMVADIIFIFFFFLSKLLNRSIAANVPEWENYSSPLRKVRVKYPIVFYFNVMGIVIIIVTGCIWGIGNIKFSADNILIIANYISEKAKIDLEKSVLLIIALSLWVLLNMLFVVAYVLAKITDFNIGKYVYIKRMPTIYWLETKGKYTLYLNNYPKDKELKKAKSSRVIKTYKKIYRIRYGISIKFTNAITRIFRRYPYMAIINVVMVVLILSILKSKQM